jgi:hypothetical protein
LTAVRTHDTVNEGSQMMEQEPGNVVLSPHAAERELESTASRILTGEQIRAWLDDLAALSDRIPAKPGETFCREMIYQDHAWWPHRRTSAYSG